MNFFNATVNGDHLLLDGHSRVPLSAEEAKLLSSYNGKEITLGVRPENIVKGSDVVINVNNCENLGQTTLIHGHINGHKATAKFREWCNYNYGEDISVSFNRMHFFDKESTNAIR